MTIALHNGSMSLRDPIPTIEPIPMKVSWAASAGVGDDALEGGIQVYEAGPSLTILRQSKSIHFEAPFLYLIFGAHKALLIDTGAVKSSAERPLQATVQNLLLKHYGPKKMHDVELLVIHSHAHGDHHAGDDQFAGKARTRLISIDEAPEFFGIREWPNDVGEIELGDRVLSVLPIPGHEGHDIAVYDPKTAVLFSGDSLYPGRLYIRSWSDYVQSIERLATFLRDRPLQWILGAHIEMSTSAGVDYPEGALIQADEHPLQLQYSDLLLLRDRLRKLDQTPQSDVQANFVIVAVI